jgi:hypothetical protein
MGGPIVGPIILEPGSLAFDYPEKYGYKLLYDNLYEYTNALSKPSWHQWLNHETDVLTREELISLIFESVVYSINERKKYGAYDNIQAAFKQAQTRADMMAVDIVDLIMSLQDDAERRLRLKSLRETIDSLLNSHPVADDPYGYQKTIKEILADPKRPVNIT